MKQVLFGIGVVAAAVSIVSASEQAAATAEQEGGVEILSARVVSEMEDISSRIWRPAKPDVHEALVITTRLIRGAGYSTKDFTLRYGKAAKTQTAICAGHTATIPGGWIIDEQTGSDWSFFPGGTGTLDGLGILFVIPKGLTEATLFYKDKPVGEAFAIKRE